MSDFTDLSTAFAWQAEFCRTSNAPLSAQVLDQIVVGLASPGPYAEALAPWIRASARAVIQDAAPLRILAVFHYLVISGRAPALAKLYPPHPLPKAAELAGAMLLEAGRHRQVMASFMATPPQTNEVGRALCLCGGFLTVAKETGLPLRCLELGASAGLNMNWDRFHYAFSEGEAWGDPAARVRLSGAWEGRAPPRTEVKVIERRGCDQSPIDVTDEDWALRLQSYVWAEQAQRMERLRSAIALKKVTGGAPERADAADWTEANLNPAPGVATVVYHSSFINYPPHEIQHRIKAAIRAAGSKATPTSPLAWLSKEPAPEDPGQDELLLTLWPGESAEGEPRRLALAHPHGAWVKWLT